MPDRALIIVDTQNDFCPGGSLPVDKGDEIAKNIGYWVDDHPRDYRVVLATKDWHVDPGDHFSETPDYKDTWPVHCMAGTPGAEFHPNLDITHIRHIFYKGLRTAAYSGFEGVADLVSGLTPDNTTMNPDTPFVDLDTYLRGRGLTAIDVVGIELRNCVRATALGGVDRGYKVRVIRDAVASLGGPEEKVAVTEMRDAGIEFI